MVEKMTLEQVRDRLREAALYGLAGSVCQVLASHLDAHLTQPAQAVDVERVAQLIAHRACCGTEHDPLNGKLHGYCVVCGVPWPCEYAGKPPAALPNANGKEDTNAAH